MTTFTLPSSLRALVGEEIASFIERYVPTTLSAEHWAAVRGAVCELTALTEPSSPADARVILNALCQLLAWAHPITGTLTLDAVLTGPLVERFTADLAPRMSESGRDGYRNRLRRCLRVRAGEPARIKRAATAVPPEPYDADELAMLQAAARASAQLEAVLRLGLQEGQIAPRGSARNHQLTGPSRSDWTAARTAAATSGIALIADRLRVTWMLQLLAIDAPVAHVVAQHGLSRRDLEKVLPKLPRPTPETERDLLRG